MEGSLLGMSEADCEPDTRDMDLWTGVALYETQGVSSASDCRDKCSSEPRCGAWTWGSQRDVQFLTDVCFLKELHPGHPMKRHAKKGVVSGLPCRPKKAASAGAAPASGQTPDFNCETGFNNWKAGWSSAKKRWCCAQRERGCKSRPKTRSDAAAKAEPQLDCHDIAHDVDYWTGTPLYEVDQISGAGVCRAKCEADPKCGAWTWGENPGVAGLEGICFLKGLADDQGPRRDRKEGVQSGVPCRTSHTESGTRSGSATTSDTESATSSGSAADAAAAAPARPTGHGNCGELEEDVDYSTSTALSEVINVATAEICLNKCEGDRKCQAWSWGKARHSYGLTDVCFLKGVRAGERPKRLGKQGVVSGMPCHTASWLAREAADGGSGLQHYQSATLNCFALMLPFSYEQKLLAMQYYEHASLFACEQYAVYSNMSVEIAPGLLTHIVNSDLHCSFGGEFGTALNNDIFLAVWKKVISDGIYLTCDWTAKVDPDAVFLPARLRGALEAHAEAPEGVYINNCWRGMHGPLEVFSRNAVQAWADGRERCLRHFSKLCNGPCLWGEDMFVDQCLWKVLGVRRDNDYALLTEDHCDPPEGWKSCKIAGSIAFHPFKKPEAYQECLFSADPLMRLATTFTTTTVATTAPMAYPSEADGAAPTPLPSQGQFSEDAPAAGPLAGGGAASQTSGAWPSTEASAVQPARQPGLVTDASANQFSGAPTGQPAWGRSAVQPAPPLTAEPLTAEPGVQFDPDQATLAGAATPPASDVSVR